MQATLEIVLANKVKLQKTAHIENLNDLGRFLKTCNGYVRAVKKLVPEFAAEKIERTKLVLE